MHVESGLSSQRRNRLLGWTVILLGLAGWFAYDGWLNWPAANEEERAKSLPAGVAHPPQIAATVTEDLGGKPSDDVRRALGSVPSLEQDDQVRYDGPTGYLLVPRQGAGKAVWRPLRKSASELWMQKVLAGIVGALGVVSAISLARAVRTKVRLDDSGLHTSRGQFIAWNRMTRLGADQLAAKGCVDLEYDDGGRPAVLRLDSDHLAEFDALVDAICLKREWPNPLGPPAAPPPDAPPNA